MQGTEESIKVLIRVRPSIDIKDDLYLNVTGNSISTNDDAKEFLFDRVSDEHTSQESIFEYTRPLFESFVDGYNATIFAYGQTGSGKTYTMTGVSDMNGKTEEPGLILRGLNFIFSSLNEKKLNSRLEYIVKCSFVEIYNEQVFDLLSNSNQRLNVHVSFEQGVSLEPLDECFIESPKEAEQIYRTGVKSRRVAETAMNRESSRSHAVFTIILESKERNDEVDNIKRSVLHLVDLAGSERQKDAQTVGARLKEACMINTSLLTLGNVIRNLVEVSKGRKRTIAYRQSKLTLMLKDALGGNSKTLLIACIHPSSNYFQETMSTLYFADRAKMIKNKAKINVDVTGDLNSLKNEILRITQELESRSIFPVIKGSEFDQESLWKTKFIVAMLLRSCLVLELGHKDDEMEVLRQHKSLLEEMIKNLKYANNVKLLLDNLPNKHVEKEICDIINEFYSKINILNSSNSEKIKTDILQLEIKQLKLELEKQRNLLSISEESFLDNIYEFYNNLIADENICNQIKKLGVIDMNSIKLQDKLNRSQLEISRLKEIGKNNTNQYKYEKYKLEKELTSLKAKNRSEQEKNHRITRAFTITRQFTTANRKCSIKNNDDDFFGVDLNTSTDIFPNFDNDEIISRLKEEVEDGKLTIRSLEEQLSGHIDLRKAFKELKHTYEEHDIKLKEYELTIKHLEMEKSELKAAKEKSMFVLNEELEDLRSVVTEMERDQSTIKEENEILRQEKYFISDKQKHMEIEMELLKQDVLSKDEIIENFRNKMRDSFEIPNISGLTHQIDQYKLENEQLQIKLSELEIKNQELDQNMSKYYLENHQLSSDLYDIKIQNTNLHEELNLMDVKYNQLDKNMHDESVQHQTLIDQMQFAHEKTIDKVNQQHTVQLHTLKEQIDLLNCEIELINQKTVDTKDTQTLPMDDEVDRYDSKISVNQKNKINELLEIISNLEDYRSKMYELESYFTDICSEFGIKIRKNKIDSLEQFRYKMKSKIEDVDRLVAKSVSSDQKIQCLNSKLNQIDQKSKLQATEIIKLLDKKKNHIKELDELKNTVECLTETKLNLIKENEIKSNMIKGFGTSNHKRRVNFFNKLNATFEDYKNKCSRLSQERSRIINWLTENDLLRKMRADGVLLD